jgi:hypothetical protein
MIFILKENDLGIGLSTSATTAAAESGGRWVFPVNHFFLRINNFHLHLSGRLYDLFYIKSIDLIDKVKKKLLARQKYFTKIKTEA